MWCLSNFLSEVFSQLAEDFGQLAEHFGQHQGESALKVAAITKKIAHQQGRLGLNVWPPNVCRIITFGGHACGVMLVCCFDEVLRMSFAAVLCGGVLRVHP